MSNNNDLNRGKVPADTSNSLVRSSGWQQLCSKNNFGDISRALPHGKFKLLSLCAVVIGKLYKT